MACDPATLLPLANCFQCLSAGEIAMVRVALLCRILNGVTASCDVQQLLAESNALNIPAGQLQLLEVAILCQIQQLGIGGA